MKKLIFFFGLILITLPSVFGLLQHGFFVSDDGEWMIIRLTAFHQALSEGQFPVRWLPRLSHEYGYPVVNFLYPGYLYISEIFHLLGFNFINSIKLILGVSLISSFIFTYFWLSRFFDKASSIIGAFIYLYFPYHLYDTYSRGSVGEVLSLAVLPATLWLITKKLWVFASVSVGLLALSHNSLALFFIPIVFLYILIWEDRGKIKKNFLEAVKIVGLGLGLSAFFWFPALFDLKWTRFSSIEVSDFSKYFIDPNLVGGYSLAIILFCFLLLLLSFKKRRKDKVYILSAFFLFLATISLFLSTSYSGFVWEIIPSGFVQFPFRFLSVTLISVAFLSSRTVSYFSGKNKYFLSIIIVISVSVSALSFLMPNESSYRKEEEYITNEATTTTKDEYLSIWVKENPIKRADNKIETSAKTSDVFIKGNKITFKSVSDKSENTAINFQYFPGWNLYIDDETKMINYKNKLGRIEFVIPPGEHQIRLKFEETNMRKIADLISIASLFVLAYFFYKEKIIKNEN